jgi:hypothetical protein
MVLRFISSAIFILTIFLGSCNQAQELPTPVPTAISPTQLPPPTFTPLLLPTQELNQQAIVPKPSPSLTPLQTPAPTPVTEELVAGIEPEVNITSPAAGSDLILGSQVVVGGLAQLGQNRALTISLISATGHLLTSASAEVSDVSSWQATLVIPPQVTGPAEIRAIVTGDNDEFLATNTQPVNLVLDAENSDRYLALFRPINDENVVSSFNLFFDGRTLLPANNQITISILSDECQVQVARQTFSLGGSGYWWGLLGIPTNITGPVCAAAHFGSPGEDTWREAQVRLNVLDKSDDAAAGVFVGQPLPGQSLNAGQELVLKGTAYNAPDNQVLVSILLENGRVLTEGVATVDDLTYNGFWELTLFIPEDAAGPAQIDVTIGTPDEQGYKLDQVLVEIKPVE